MTIEEIVQGESKNVEFKAVLPSDSEKYVKTIIAFANTQGGQLIIGVDDKTREVIGVDEDILFRLMDSISNAVSDSCVPQIVPNVEPQTVNGKTIIVVTTAPGPNRPYYLKSKGKETGTFIRVSGTSRPAQPNKIKELEMEGARISWDELICVGYTITEEAVEKLCDDIMSYRKRAGLSQRDVTKAQLINWKLLREGDNYDLASNAFVLLTSDYFSFSKTQCAVFKGTERNVFLDKREFSGAIYEQIDEAVKFVLRNIRLGATIEGLIRKESYELPVEAIREMIINAHCHRNLTDDSCVQVAIYDDRLEVTSPGGLYNGLTYEDILNGHSRLRNRTIANVFNQMGLIEAWGTGIKRIITLSEMYDLPAPEIQVFDSMFRVNLYRRNSSLMYGCNIGETLEKHRRNIGEASEKHRFIKGMNLNDTQRKILVMLSEDARLSASKMADQIGISKRNVESNIKKLKAKGILVRHGSPKSGYWEIID
ncbi:MAG: winged helix-turn-helix transcriptional regulator [Firmicutes bacterium]|nr:winged helix-turn-helix transcriptional regulator [Bacillota bacterium]